MAVSEARERSYIRALMYLGPAPALDERLGVVDIESSARWQDKLRKDISVYKRSMTYHEQLNRYFTKHVFQGMTSALGNTDDWIEGFLAWQKAAIVESMVHDEVVIRQH